MLKIVDSQTYKEDGELVLVLRPDRERPVDANSYGNEAAQVAAALDSWLCGKTMEEMAKIMAAKFLRDRDAHLYNAVVQCTRDLNKAMNEWENNQ